MFCLLLRLLREPVRTVTSFAKHYFSEFDANKVVDNYYASWASNPQSKYHALIQSVLSQTGATQEDAKQAIKSLWEKNRDEASAAGTKMHADAEIMMNGLVAQDTPEMQLLSEWRRTFQPHMRWVPERTEWPLWYADAKCNNRVLTAGMLDLLMRSETHDVYALVDWKRCNPNPKFKGGPPNLLGPAGNLRYHPGYGRPPLQEVEDSDFGKYAMQLNVLAKILHDRYRIDVEDRMFLVQLHPDLEEAHTVQVPFYKEATESLFRVELERYVQALTKEQFVSD